jgi:hypothetical protein
LILKRLKNQYRDEHIFIRGIYSLGYVNSVEVLNVKLAINPTLNYIIATNKASATEQILNKYNIVSIDEAKKTNGIAVVGDYSVEDKLNNIKGNPVIIMLYKFTGEQANTIKIPVLYKTDKITNIFNKI